MEPVDAISLSTFQATLNVGIQAAFQLTQAVWPAMKARGGTLVFVTSRSGIEGFADETAYCAAKHALEGFSKCLALEGAAHGIVSVTITPGMYMHTPMSETTYPPEARAKWVDPMRLAPAFAMLATRPTHLSGQRLDAWALSQHGHRRHEHATDLRLDRRPRRGMHPRPAALRAAALDLGPERRAARVRRR